MQNALHTLEVYRDATLSLTPLSSNHEPPLYYHNNPPSSISVLFALLTDVSSQLSNPLPDG